MNSSLPSEVVRVVSLLLEDLSTPRSLSVAIMVRYGEWDEILGLTLDPRDYLEADASHYAADAAATGLLRKLQELPSSVDKAKAALDKWWEGERQCKRTNFRLEPYLAGSLFPEERDPEIARFVLRVRSVVKELIGNRPPHSRGGKFGPGATATDRGRHATMPDKMTSRPSLTRSALGCVVEWRHNAWGRSFLERQDEQIIDEIRGNRFTTVPKTAKTDRAIAAEPSLNVFYQLDLGLALKQRLLESHGWDLNAGEEIHQQVAEKSSISREFATLDLSNASDTVAKSLVKLLLPQRWYEALASLRCPFTDLHRWLTPESGKSDDGSWVMLEKFSSMGNGFTFELETVLFSALSIAVVREGGGAGVLGHDVFVYGDDIIVPTTHSRRLKSVLEFFGFKLSWEKSFYSDEPFRESCGGDYFAGQPVRPYFLKELPDGPQEYIAMANGISALTERLGLCGLSLRRRAWLSVLDNVPTRVRACRGPKDLGDIVIHDAPERWTCRVRSSIRYLLVLKPGRKRKVNVHAFAPGVSLACALYGIGSSHPKGWAWHKTGGFVPRKGVIDYRIGWVPYS